jgi:hypothetical protein
MSGLEKFHNIISIFTTSFTVDNEAVEELRLILEKEKNREVSHDEAEKIGRDLITIMEALANGRVIVAQRDDKEL